MTQTNKIEDKAVELMANYPCGITVEQLIKGSGDLDPNEVLKEMIRIAQF